jgi:hypothetical protein
MGAPRPFMLIYKQGHWPDLRRDYLWRGPGVTGYLVVVLVDRYLMDRVNAARVCA